MSSQAQQPRPTRPEPGPTKPPAMTSAARAALAAQQQGKPLPKPYKMPEVEIGEVVMYMDGFYNRHATGSPAIVTEVDPRAVELSVFTKEAPNLRILGSAVRHKDDPEVERLARVNSNSEEPEGFGVWYREDWMLTPTEKRRLKQLLSIYAPELDEYAKSGTINGKPIRPDAGGEGKPAA